MRRRCLQNNQSWKRISSSGSEEIFPSPGTARYRLHAKQVRHRGSQLAGPCRERSMHHVHFVGSVALDTPEEVFATIGQHCGPYLKRVPDGEPGGRRLWISWQIPVLRANPSLVQVGEGQIPLKLAEGVTPEHIHFGELGYAREARPSYEGFLAARRDGKIPSNVRFQVSLPTPWAVVMPFCRQPDAQQIVPAYEQA